MNPWVGDVFVSILPCWHIFERTAEYFTLTRGVTMVGYHDVTNLQGIRLRSMLLAYSALFPACVGVQ